MPIIDPMDVFKVHQSNAGKVGGRSRSAAKVAACRLNAAKARLKRHNQVTGPQPTQPIQQNEKKPTI